MMRKGPLNPERSFGVSVGGVLCAIAAYLTWRGRIGRAETSAAIGSFLLVFGLVYPPLLRWPSVLWWRFARFLGHVNARVWLIVLFAIVLVPVSALWRIIGKDPLSRRRRQFPGWSEYPPRYRDRRHYSRMY
jgi:hypothetical protein